ncbi:MAG TPA: translocation/assembly module TamB domain-containing protein [Polyangiaceae bacterium]|nr:translocation/assembly module TamB domain-containing protein [Polyangiaceae bacterium]
MARAHKWRRLVGKIAAWFFGLLVAVVVAALLGINLPFARALIAKKVTAALEGVVSGKIVIDHVGRVGLTGVAGVRGRLTDATGRTLVTASGLSARLRTFTLVKSLFGKSGLDVHLDSVSIDHVDALLDADSDGNLLVQKALASPPPPPSAPPSKPSTLTLVIDEARLGSAWLHGRPSPAFLVDDDLREMQLGVTLSGGKTTLDLKRLAVVTRAMPSDANVHANLTAHVVLPPAPQQPAATGSFDGTVGDVHTSAQGSLNDGVVDAHLRADAAADSLARFAPSLRLRNPARLSLDASGTLPNLRAVGTITTGSAAVKLAADGALGTPFHGHVELEAEHVDLSAVMKDGAPSDLNAHLRANVTVPKNGTPIGNFDLETKPARFDAQPVPAVALKGTLTRSEGDVTLDVAEPGAKTHATGTVDLRKREIVYDASISIPDFTQFRRVPMSSKGSASVRLRGTAYLTTRTVSTDLRARVVDAAGDGVRVRKADVGALVTGPFSNPDVDAKIVATGLVAAGRSFEAGALSLKGNLHGFGVGVELDGKDGTPDVNASTKVDLGERITLSNTEAKIGEGEDRLHAHVETVRIAGRVIQADGVTVDGAGAALSAAARIAPDAMDVRAISAGLDVGKATRALGLTKLAARGKLALDVDLKTRAHTAKGKLGVELTQGAYGGVEGLDLRVATSVDGKRFTGQIEAKVDGGHVNVDADDLTLGGSVFSPEAWSHAVGRVRIDSNVDVGRLAKVLPTSMLPFDDMAGHVALSGELTRGADDPAPETTWTLHTDGFRASAKSEGQAPHDGTRVRAPPAWHTAGIDVDGTFAIAKKLGHTTLQAQFRDAVGQLATVDATADLPYRELVQSGGASAEALESAPFHVRFAVPRRKLSKLPPILATAGIDGDFELTLEASETARAPVVALDTTVHQLSARGARRATPVDVHLDAKYGDGLGKLSLDVNAKGKRALSLESEVHAKVADFLDDAKGDWDASVKGKVDAFPLDVLSMLGSRSLKGTISGDLDAATGTHVAPRASAKLSAEGVALGRDRSGGARATLAATADDHGMNAHVRFDQPDGFAEATASAGLTWTGPLSPTVDPAKGAARAEATAKHFRLSVLQPLVQTVVADLDGRLDANARFEAAAAHGAPKLDGSVVLDQGSFELTSAGQEFHDVHADVTLRQDGTLRAENVVAHGLSGTLKASGEATLDGLNLKRAKLSAKVPLSDPFPISLQGQSLAKTYGDFNIEAVPAPDKQEIDITVDVPSAKVTMFDKSTHELQALDADEHVRVGYHRKPDEFVVVPLARPARVATTETPTTVVAAVKLHDVEVVRGTDLRVQLEGTPKIRMAQTTSISGQIRLRSGYLYVQGKKFEIQNGTVTFIGEPDNPNVVVTAAWTAPEGTVVYADFVGPLKTGKVTLRSEPSHSKNEILSLILFGTTDGMGASSNSSSSTATTAASVAGGVATQGLNKALDDLTGLDITTRIDTSDSSNPRPEVEVRVARDVTVAISHVIGVPPPGTNPDLNWATVDWRFLRNWSLNTTLGDQGSSMLDLIWTYRY